MEKFSVRFSLRYKLLILLITLPLISLSLYLLIATDLFKSDKKAYVYDSSATVSRALARQMRMETQSAYDTFRALIETFDSHKNEFPEASRAVFQKNKRIHALLVFQRNDAGQYEKRAQLVKDLPAVQAFMKNEAGIKDIRDEANVNGVAVIQHDELPGSLKMAFRLGDREDPKHMVLVSLYQADDLLGAFQDSRLYASFSMTGSGRVAIMGQPVSARDVSLLKNVLSASKTDSTADLKLSDGKHYLISHSQVGLGDLVIVSKVDRSKAFKAVEVLVAKSALFFVALISSTLLISVFASNQLTSSLRELFEATTRLAQGHFDVRVQPRSKDEVGGLAEGFNFMAGEVSRLMVATAEKARMESELTTVRTVQETLFPPAQAQFGALRISGHFEPASECGGDWWSYSRVGNKIFLWVGDATGHGAPAALITSAARSAASIIESMEVSSPGEALTILNRAIHQTSKGQIMMTFFLAAFDLDEGRFTYASASHDPPYHMRRTGERFTKNDLNPLNDVNGPRLGEQKDHKYDEITVEFQPGDLLFFYTDGILDIADPSGKKWGERNVLKSLVESVNGECDTEGKLSHLKTKLNDFRSGSQLIDDVTMIMCEYEKRAA